MLLMVKINPPKTEVKINNKTNFLLEKAFILPVNICL